MIDRTKPRSQRVRELLASLPDDCGVLPADLLDSNGETRPVDVEIDADGQMLLPYMQGAGLAELPSLDTITPPPSYRFFPLT